MDADKTPAKLGMDLYSERVCRMARGRHDARKKPETSSSADKGRAREFMLELARVFPSQKEKTGFNYRHFL